MRSLAPCHGASALVAPCQRSSLELQALKCTRCARGCSARPPSGSPGAPHRTTRRDSEMTAKNNHPELIDQLTEGIANLTSSDELAALPRLPEPLSPLQLRQRAPHRSPVPRGDTGRRLQRLAEDEPLRPQGREGHLDSRPHGLQERRRRGRRERPVIRGFKFVGVFDVAQTDGEELPSICNRIDGDDPAGLYAQLVTVAESIGFASRTTSSAAPPTATAPTTCTASGSRPTTPRPSGSRPSLTRSPTLSSTRGHKDRALAELEAESTAYVVCQALGIDSERLLLRVRRNLGRWRRGGHRRDQGILRANPEDSGDHPAGLRASNR